MRFSTFLITILALLVVVLVGLLALSGFSSDESGKAAETGQQADASRSGPDGSPASGSAAAKGGGAKGDGAEAPKGSESSSGRAAGGQPPPGAAASAAPSGAPLSKAVFIKRGDAICGAVPPDFQSRLAKLEKEKRDAKQAKPSAAEIAAKASIPPLVKAVGKLEELAAPAGDERRARAIVAALESAAEGLEKDPSAEFSGPKSPFAEFQKLTGEYGFKVCPAL